ncbi:MAG TPA: hypothetical protein VJN69_13280 [Candidatus Acidoferrales bacterium]|nr:hypothetical protein [Candidatus Acidoferrales bacterium]
MSSGFNTDVSRGERVFHVQTEDRGPQHPSIDTVVYRNGYILHRHSWNYSDAAARPDFSADDLKQRVEAQHRSVIEALRDGNLDAEIATAEEQAVRAAGIQVQLLNPTSWLAAGKVSLEIGVIRRADRKPVSDAHIQASIAGALDDASHHAKSDGQGVAAIRFDLPPLGKGDLALVIGAQSDPFKDEIRFSMRSRTKNAQNEPAS